MDLQVTLALYDVGVHESIMKILNKNHMYGKRILVLSRKHIATHLKFAKVHLNNPSDYWNNVLQTDGTINENFY